MPARKPSSGKRASKKTVKATETKFGKPARVAAQRGGKKPVAWQQSEAPRRPAYVPPPSSAAATIPANQQVGTKSPSAAVAKINGINSDALEKATGKGWEAWLSTMDADDARRMTHAEIVRHLRTDYALDSRWSQTVAVGYEQSRGLAVLHPAAHGSAASCMRTLEASASDVFRAFNDPTRRSWCHERLYSVQTAVAPRMLKLAMPDKSIVTVAILRKGNTRSAVSVEQTKLADAASADRARSAWKQALERLAGMLDD